ncbi:Lrp/AsnC family transcriptional regulator [uncultured Agrococcus sp.]|uniref:Lrp/AsnC family transcriptional regulator n=1 Tax=uncultured Agrococcus sp. TaxID=382258 RepID=UPI0025E76BA3|nr:Lrp/AsnC family transcriptional regulator [uncultured Agrococcus sp.]
MNPRSQTTAEDSLRTDATDRKIIDELRRNGRIPNAQLANAVGLSPSSCHSRVKALQRRGVIRGFTAEVDPGALGCALQALVFVRIHPRARAGMEQFANGLRARPEVAQLYFLGGSEDFLIHLWVRDSNHVRDFVLDALSANPAVAHTDTKLIFEHHRAETPSAM